jgi:hypothetical protein
MKFLRRIRGRVQTSVAWREALLAEFEKSGMSAKKFALFVGLKHQTFAAWVTKRRKAGQQQPSPTCVVNNEAVVSTTAARLPSPSVCKPQHVPATTQPLLKLQWVEAVVEKDSFSPNPEEKYESLTVHLRVEHGWRSRMCDGCNWQRSYSESRQPTVQNCGHVKLHGQL